MSVVAWGCGLSGALGTGDQNDHLYPVIVGGQLQGKHVVGVSCGDEHSIAVDDLGMVYAWGRNREGQCGQGNTSPSVLTPQRVEFLLHERIVKVIAGSHQSFAITDDGKLYRWGLFHYRATDVTPQYFGLTGIKDISQETKEMIDRSHYLYFSNKTDFNVEEMASAYDDVEAVGAFRRRYYPIPEQLDIEGKKVIDVAAGFCFFLVVTEDGAVYSFGFNDKGQLGLGNRFSQESPKRITALDQVRAVKAIAGQQHSAILTEDGRVASWGGGVFGLGHGDGDDLLVPKFIQAFEGKRVTQFACGTYHTFCVTQEGEIYSFGHGEYGQQGTGDLGERGEQHRNALFPRKMEKIPWNSPISRIECGHLHTLFTLADGTIWTCGWGTRGVLGHGDAKYRLIPTQIKALEGDAMVEMSGGHRHNLAIKEGATTFALDFEKLLASTKNTDITFIVDRKPIHAHQAIVCYRCPAIRSMVAFNTRFARINPNQRNEFEIKGTRFVVFKALLHFLYTDHLNVAPFFAPEVAALAKRFHLPRLYGLSQQLFFRAKNEKVQLPPSTFSQDLFQLIDEPRHSDIVFDFTKPENSFFGHRMILVARCPYFRTFFEGGHFRDSELSKMNMSSCPVSQEVFQLSLQFIYTGDRSIVTPEVAMELLAAADYFLLDDLKRICEDVVEKNLEVEQETLEVVKESAELYGAKRLAHFCQTKLQTL